MILDFCRENASTEGHGNKFHAISILVLESPFVEGTILFRVH